MAKLSHSAISLRFLCKETSGDIVITLQSILWKNSQWVAQILGGYIVNKIVKETRVFFHKEPTGFCAVFFSNVITMWSLGTLWSKWVFFFKCNHNLIPGYMVIKVGFSFQKTQHVPRGFLLSKVLKKSQFNHHVNPGYMHSCPQC